MQLSIGFRIVPLRTDGKRDMNKLKEAFRRAAKIA